MATITQQIKELKSKREDIDAEIEALELQKESKLSSNIIKALKGTTFGMDKCGKFFYINNTTIETEDDAFQALIYKDAELYPHGRKQLDENLIIGCDDSTIYLDVFPCQKIGKKLSIECKANNSNYYVENVMLALKFAKKYGIKIDFFQQERRIEQLKHEFTMLESELVIYKAFMEEENG